MLRRLLLRSTLFFLAVSIAGCAADPSRPVASTGGMNILLSGDIDFSELEEALWIVRGAGASVVVLDIQWCLDDVDGEVYECERTPDEDSLAEAVARAREHDFEVRLRFLVNEAEVGWRGAIPPREAWMSSYRDLLLASARFCQTHDVDGLYVVSELHDAMWRRPGWVRDLIWDARSEYQGTLAVTDFIWTDHVMPDDWFLSAQHPFGAGINLVGASYYPEIDDCAGNLDEEMAAYILRVRESQELFLLQIDEISEFGTVPACNANSSSWSSWDDVDEAYQAAFYDAILDSIADLGVERALCWGLELGHPDRAFGPFAPGEDALDVLASRWHD